MTTPDKMKAAMLAQFTPEALQQHKDLCAIIQAQHVRKKPVRKEPVLPVEPWVWPRYVATHKAWHEVAHKEVVADGHAYTEPVKKDFTDTNHIVSGIINFINWQGGKVQQYNVEGRDIKQKDVTTASGEVIIGKTVRIKSSAKAGCSDIVGTIKGGRAIEIEVKNKYTKDTIKPHQIKNADRATKAGALHFFARDMESFIRWWDSVVMRSNNPTLV